MVNGSVSPKNGPRQGGNRGLPERLRWHQGGNRPLCCEASATIENGVARTPHPSEVVIAIYD